MKEFKSVYMFGRVFIPVSNGKKIIKNLSNITTVISKIKWNIFHSLRCNEENLHDVRCLTAMTSTSH